MLRLQQDRVLPGVLDPTNPYQPPWTDKHFYLLDGFGRRQIIVDESNSPRKFKDCNHEKMEYLRPTAGKLMECHKDLEPHRVKNSEHPIQFKPEYYEVYEEDKSQYTSNAWRRRKPNRANPMLINQDWEVVVRELEWNVFESLYPIWKQEAERQRKEKLKNDSDVRVESDATPPSCQLVKLPQDIWENIVSYLDGLSFLRLGEAVTDVGIAPVLWDALVANLTSKKSRNFWRETCIQNISQFSEIVTSYSNCVVERGGASRRTIEPYYDASLDHDSQDAVEARHDFIYKLTHGQLEVKNMATLEERIKTNIQMHHQLKKEKKETGLFAGKSKSKETPTEKDIADHQLRPYAPHKFVVGTIGPICYYVINPYLPLNLIILEDLDRAETRRVSAACNSGHIKQGILYTKIMYFPRYKEITPEAANVARDDNLPEIDPLIFTVCPTCISGRSVDGLRGFCYPYEVIDEEAGTFNKMEPILAFHDDVFVLWHSPMSIEFHKVTRSDRQYGHTKFASFLVKDANTFWNLLSNYTQFFIPVLKKVRNAGACEVDKRFIREFFGDTEADKDYYYELRFINMRFGTDSISFRNSVDLKPKPGDICGASVPYFEVYHRNPQYYYHNALKYRSLLDICYSGCHGHDLYIFWNHKALAISWGDGTTWLFNSWKEALAPLAKDIPFFADSRTIFVSQMTVCSREVVAAVINGHVIIFKALKSSGGTYQNRDNPRERYADEPTFIMEPLRLVALDLKSQGMTVDQFTFSFDIGQPYFMLLYRKTHSECPLNFWITRLCFNIKKVQDAVPRGSVPSPSLSLMEKVKRKRQVTRDIENPSNILKNHSFAEAIVMTVLSCKLLNLKKRAGLVSTNDDCAKSYSELVDDIMSNVNNQKTIFDLTQYPNIVYQSLEWAEELQSIPEPQPGSSNSSRV